MKTYNRKYPLFSLCGLKCGLCPNHHSTSSFRCPGCGGKEFYSKHPTCSIVSCSLKHDNIEFCYLCKTYPCSKYDWMKNEEVYDSFITYRNVENDIEKIKKIGIDEFYTEIEEKTKLLIYLLENYNSGRQRNFFCIAVNLFEIDEIKNLISDIERQINPQLNLKEKSAIAVYVFQDLAKRKNISLKLQKRK